MSSIFRLYLSGTTLDSLRWIGRWNDGDFPSPRAKCTHPGAGGPHRWGLSAPLCQKNAIEIVQKFEEHCEIFLGQFVHNTQRMELLAWQPPPSKTNFIRGRKHFGGGKYPSSPIVGSWNFLLSRITFITALILYRCDVESILIKNKSLQFVTFETRFVVMTSLITTGI